MCPVAVFALGSVYELFGRACSLSTGELVKIIDITITRFIAHTADAAETVLPLDYPGTAESSGCVRSEVG